MLNGKLTCLCLHYLLKYNHSFYSDEAEGFCYINDICIGIQRLREKFKRILYIDLDVHHGNGVENAFSYSKRVFTLSFHQYETGFYPGTGGVNEVGAGHGKGYSCNFPYKSYVSGKLFCRYFERYAIDNCVNSDRFFFIVCLTQSCIVYQRSLSTGCMCGTVRSGCHCR